MFKGTAPSVASSDPTLAAAPTTVVIVDDHRSFAEFFAEALNNVPGVSCVGIADGTASEGVALAARLRPDIVVMDIRMPGQDGLAATSRIRQVAPDTVVAVVTARHDPLWVTQAAEAGGIRFHPQGRNARRDDRSARPGPARADAGRVDDLPSPVQKT